MNKIKSLFLILPILALAGCGSLDKTGVYNGDKFLYDADLAIASSYTVLHSFVKYEYDNRSVLANPQVTKYADEVRRGCPQWFGSALAIRDAYKANPNAGTKSALQAALDVIHEAVNQATKYMVTPTATQFSPVQSSIPPPFPKVVFTPGTYDAESNRIQTVNLPTLYHARIYLQ